MFSKKGFLFALLFVVTLISTQAQSKRFVFPSDSWVSDKEGLFTPQQQSELNKLILDFKSKTNSEINILTINTYAPFSNMNDFSRDLSNNWHMIGHDDAQNSLLIIVSKSLRTVRITTAYGTEKLLVNETCKKIINSDMVPAYTKGNYFAGTKQGLLSLMRIWN